MKLSSLFSIIAGMLTVFAAIPCVVAQSGELVLEVEPSAEEVLERLPLIVRLTIRNTGNEPDEIRFSQRNPEIIARYSALALTDGEREYRLTFVGGPQPNIPVQPADIPLPPGASIVTDRVVSLIVRTPPAPASGEHDDWYRDRPLAPAAYRGYFEIDAAPGRMLISNEFDLTIVEPQGTNRNARDAVAFRHVSFFEGRDPGKEEYFQGGGKTRYGVDVSRFREIQDILDNHPDSPYAEWIRFWKLYHHGPVDDALEYARDHRAFPLADNLMLHVAEGLFNQAGKYDRATYDRVRELVAESLRDFPAGDTRARALDLQQKLTKKP